MPLSTVIPVALVLLVVVLAYRRWRFNALQQNRIPPPDAIESSQYDKILSDHIAYYNKLNTAQKARFRERLHYFMKSRRIVGMDGFIITNEAKVLVSAAATQLTFGLTDYLIPNINVIGIYPTHFYSDIIQREVKGLTYPTGVLYISYEDLLEGYKQEHDKFNLGLHEMSHALKIYIEQELAPADSLYYLFSKFDDEIQDIKEGVAQERISFLRSYAATNNQEFFAVCVEHFFEAPEVFKTELPKLYALLVQLLNQDPLNLERLTPGNVYTPVAYMTKPVEEDGEEETEDGPSNPVSRFIVNNFPAILFFGFLTGFTYTVIVMRSMDKPFEIFWYAVGLTIASSFPLYNILVRKKYLDALHLGGFLIFSIFPLSLFVLMFTNNSLIIKETTEIHAIQSYTSHLSVRKYQLEGDPDYFNFSDEDPFNTLTNDLLDQYISEGKLKVRVTFERGILGWKKYTGMAAEMDGDLSPSELAK